MNILVVAAHPDDEVLGCGGTIARSVAEGHRVTVAILGQGAASRYSRGTPEAAVEIGELEEMSRNAGRILGVDDVRHFGLPDNRFDSVDLLDVVKILEELGRELQPEIVYTQHGGDLNIDHAITFRAAMTAFRPVPGTGVRALYAYEVASSTEWAFGKFSPPFAADTFVNIDNFLEKKIQALAAYESEIRSFPHPRSLHAVRTQATERGARIGVAAAEAFETVWRRL
jgi:LmbE family N-acetylglucosaminyl deacetylase